MALFQNYSRLLYLLQEIYREYNPPGTGKNNPNFEIDHWQQEFFKNSWKFAQAKHGFHILRLIAFFEGLSFNALKDMTGEISAQSLTNQLKQLQDLRLITRHFSSDPPLTIKYVLTDFGMDYCLMSIPYFVFFMLKPFWEIICQEYDRNPPNVRLLDGSSFPNLQKKVQKLQYTKGTVTGIIKSTILLSPFGEKAMKLIFTAMQMTKDMLAKLTPDLPDPDRKERLMAILTEAVTALQGKYLFDITYILYNCGPLSFNDLKRFLPDINSLTLSTRLKELEHDEILTRTVESEIPLRVSYNLTLFGTRLMCTFWPLASIAGLYQLDT